MLVSRKRLAASSTAAFFALATDFLSDPATIAGAARVVDGDTLELGGEYVRIIGIGAPKSDEPGGTSATTALRELVGDGVSGDTAD